MPSLILCCIIIYLIPNPLEQADNLFWNYILSFLQAKGGGLAFLQGYASSLKQNNSDGNAQQEFLVYINGDHEYILFDPYGNEANEFGMSQQDSLVEFEETGWASFTKSFTILIHIT